MAKANSYVDNAAITQVIGCVFNESRLLDIDDKYFIIEDDFPDEFHKIIFGAMYNLHAAETEITLDSIIDYLNNRPQYDAVFQANKGVDYLRQAAQLATRDTFNYYYQRMKKMTLLRAYTKYGVDVSEWYDPDNILDINKKQEQEIWLDSHTTAEIAAIVDGKIDEVKQKYLTESYYEGSQIGEGITEIVESLQEHPEVGAPLYGRLINSVTRGARVKKLYLRSAATGTGLRI